MISSFIIKNYPFILALTVFAAAILRCKKIISSLRNENISLANKAKELDKYKQRLTFIEEFDDISGIYNRQAFAEHTRKMLNSNPDKTYALVRMDINNFKVYNDLYGTTAGDHLLAYIGSIFRKCISPNVTYGRFEADHFVFCCPADGLNMDAITEQAETYLDSYPSDFKFSSCFGVYIIENADIDIEVMCDRALLVIRSIKGIYDRKYAFYDEELRDRLILEQDIVSEMSNALKTRQFELYFQPQYDYSTNSIIGSEALVRWNHPVRGLIPPAMFIPLFEKNGFITSLDNYVWEEACMYLNKWLYESKTLNVPPVSVNISRLDVYKPNLCDIFKGLVEKYDIPISLLKLEITESAYVEDPQQLIGVVKQLQAAGFVVEMDDFGSGYSSLNSLKDFPVNVLKLDLKFLDGKNNERGGNIITSVIRMASWLNMTVIAEGVETKNQADYLISLGCQYMQGYYYARPMPAPDFEKLISTEPVTPLRINEASENSSINLVWNPDSRISYLFNNYDDGVAIAEYKDNRLEIVRVNTKFYSVLGTTKDVYEPLQKNILDRFYGDYKEKYIEMLNKAASTNEQVEFETRSRPLDASNKDIWTKTMLKVISRHNERVLVYILVKNISDEKNISLQPSCVTKDFLSLIDVFDQLYEFDFSNQAYTPLRSTLLSQNQLGKTMPLYHVNETWRNKTIQPEDIAAYYVLNHTLKDDIAAAEAFVADVKNGNSRVMALLRIKSSAGIFHWMVVAQCTEKHSPHCVLAFMDVDMQIRKELNTETSLYSQANSWKKERYRILSENLNYITFDYDPLNDVMNFTISNNGIKNLSIKNYVKRLTENKDSYVHPNFVQVCADALVNAAKHKASGIFDYMANYYQKGYNWHRAHWISVVDCNDNVYRIVGRIENIHAEKKREENLRKKAENDDITGLFNRFATQSLIDSLIAARDNKSHMIFILMDIDNFKNINDSYGHLAGDKVLETFGHILKTVFRKTDIAGRIGGDEFVLFVKDVPLNVALDKLNVLQQKIDTFYSSLNIGGSVSVSIGVYEVDESCKDFNSAYSKADKAMYKAKNEGKNCIKVY